MNAQSRFTAYEAAKARAEAPVPLLVGLTGPSGSGKTFSALRIATGIREVVGGEIFVVDTEQRRALHYADKFQFKHVNFGEPFGSLDYLEALRFCKAQGAGVVVIDSCSHEHDGPGGLLEQHEAELTRMAGNDFKKRDRMQMLAWQKPKAARRKLINAITTELAMPVIFCFRAKKTTKPKPGQQPIDMGFSTIGADEWLFEMALNALLLPGSRGVPTWQSELPGEMLAIKLPEQFIALAQRGGQLNEAVGRSLAKWAAGTPVSKAADAPKQERRRFEAEQPEPNQFADDLGDAPDDPFGLPPVDHREGRDDTDTGGGFNEDPPASEDPRAARLAATREQIATATNERGLKAVDAEWQKHSAAYDDAEVAEINGLIAARRKELG